MLRQAQHEDEWETSELSTFLMLSLSKHEEAAPKPPTSVFPAQAGTQTLTHRWDSIIWIPAFAGNAVERQRKILVLRQPQDEDEFEIPKPSLFLMLSLSKHEEAAPKPPHPCSPRRRGPRPLRSCGN